MLIRLFSCCLILLLAGCSTTAPSIEKAPVPKETLQPDRQGSATGYKPERPLPYRVDLPMAFEQAVANGTRTLDGRPGPDYWQQAAQYSLKAQLFPEDKRLEGQARIRYTNHSPNHLENLFLELSQNLHAPGSPRLDYAEVTEGVILHRVVVGGVVLEPDAEAAPRYLTSGTQLVLEAGRDLAPGATVEIEVAWSFTIPQEGASGRMGHSQDNFFYLAYWYPQMSVYDDVYGWFMDPFRGQAEFYHGFADYELTVEAPEGWLVAATGALQNADEVLTPAVAQRMRQAHQSDTPLVVVGPDDLDRATQQGTNGRLSWHFSAENVRDAAFSVTRASVWEAARTPVDTRDGKPVYAAINTFYRQNAPRWKEVTRYQQHVINHHSRYTGFPYPWPHMTAVEGSDIITGGMEYPMMTLIGDYNVQGDSALYYVTSHELAHMWIPMIVGNNERRHSWIDEGSTTFLENVSRHEFFPGVDHYAPDRETYLWAAMTEEEGEMMRWADFHHTGTAFFIASYSKPATLLVTLRGLLGEETFLKGYQTFIRTWAFKHPTPYDFFNTFEAAAGMDLDWFWHSWYFETWTLDQAIESVQIKANGIDITVLDQGKAPMPARLTVTFTDGTTQEVTIPVEVWLEGKIRSTVFVETSKTVQQVAIDAQHVFPDIDRDNNIWEP